jgi:outer membrane protein assembly factor BamB
MGLLMRTLSCILPLGLLVVSGCSGLRLQLPPAAVMPEERLATRNNVSPTPLPPPLAKVWEADIAAGVGSDGPVVVDTVVFVGTMRGELLAFGLRSGRQIGKTNAGPAIHGRPIVDRNLVIIPLAGELESLVAYDVTQSTIRWRATLGDILVTPLLLNGRVYAGSATGNFACLDRVSGVVLWTFRLADNHTLKGIRSAPAGLDTIVIFGADDAHIYALHAPSGRLLWRCSTDAPVHAPVTLAGSTAYTASLKGTVYALDARTGSTRWSFPAGSPVYGALVVTENSVLIGTTEGKVTAVDLLSGIRGWEQDLHDPISAGGLATGPYVYFGTLKRTLVALDAASGEVVWSTQMSGRIKTAPVAAQDRILVVTDDRVMHAMRREEP